MRPPAHSKGGPHLVSKPVTKLGFRGYPRYIRWLSVFGALSLIALIFGIFYHPGRRPPLLEATKAPAIGTREFLVGIAGAAASPLLTGGSVRLLNNGVEFFPALFEAIRKAEHTINFLVFIWEPGVASDQVFAALIERARAGVEVRVLLDGVGGYGTPDESIEALRAVGGKVETFRSPSLGKLNRFHRRTHRRAIVMDGKTAFTGGMAVGDKWLGNADSPEHWRDSMVEVTGPLATTVQSAFVAPWAHTTGELLSGSWFFPEEPQAAPRADDSEPVTLHTGIASSPVSEAHPLRLFFVQTFVSAQRTLYITTPYFVPCESIRKAVADAARRGVDVRLLLPNENTDATPIRRASHHFFERLLEAGVRIYEYQPTMHHSKTVVADGQWSIVGSPNMDIRSKELNEENVLGIQDVGFAKQLEVAFLDDLKLSKEFHLAEWRKRGAWARSLEWLTGSLVEYY